MARGRRRRRPRQNPIPLLVPAAMVAIPLLMVATKGGLDWITSVIGGYKTPSPPVPGSVAAAPQARGSMSIPDAWTPDDMYAWSAEKEALRKANLLAAAGTPSADPFKKKSLWEEIEEYLPIIALGIAAIVLLRK